MDLTKVDRIIADYDGEKASLVMILQDVQEAYNYLPEPAMKHVAQSLDIPRSHVYNVSTFYSSFSLTERGRHLIKVCDGTACHLRGAPNLREEIGRELNIGPGETTEDRMFTLDVVACLGACALAPVMTIGSKYYGNLTPAKLKAALAAHRKMTEEDIRPSIAAETGEEGDD